MSTDFNAQNFHVDLANIKLMIGALGAVIFAAIGLTLWAMFDWLNGTRAEYQINPGFILFVFVFLVALVTIVVAALSIRTYISVLKNREADSFCITVKPDGVSVSTHNISEQFKWSDVTCVASDNELLYQGLWRKTTLTALLLYHADANPTPTLKVRWALRPSKQRRALFHPFRLPGMTVIPIYFFNRPEAKRLISAAQQSHQRAKRPVL